MSEQPVTVTIPYMEHYAFSKQYELFHQCIVKLFEHVLKSGGLEQKFMAMDDIADSQASGTLARGGLAPLHETMPQSKKEFWYHRFATAITAYLADPTYTHTRQQLTYINLFKPHLQDAFFVSQYGSMDHILWHRGLVDKDNTLIIKNNLDTQYILACHTLYSAIEVDYHKLVQTLPYLALESYIGLLTNFQHPFDDHARANFAHIFNQHTVMASHPDPKTSHIARIVPGWMNCSYWDTSKRHDYKRSANKMISTWLDNTLSKNTKKRATKNAERRPGEFKRVVIASEKYRTSHAVYRCYHTRIAALKEKYYTILVTNENDYDENSGQDFHEVLEVSKNLSEIEETVETIAALGPDLILYPSLGMTPWTIATCNLRLAPIQLMSYGHPASACTETIDFGVIGGIEGVEYQRFLNETLTPHRLKTRPHTPHPDFSSDMKWRPPNDGIVRIAINSALMKISLRVINLCSLLEQYSSNSLEFHFFSAAQTGAKHTAFIKSLSSRLDSDFVVHREKPYRDYMDALSKCDLALGTFPFGGSNTNVDTLLLGIPKIIYTEGSDLASYTDLQEIGTMGLDNLLNTTNEQALIGKLIHLIHNSTDRDAISSEILKRDPELIFFKPESPDIQHQFVNAIRWIEQQFQV